MLAARVRPSRLIPTVELMWTICTFAASTIKTPAQLYVIRFLIGLFESAYFPTAIYVLGSWYKSAERGKRLTIFVRRQCPESSKYCSKPLTEIQYSTTAISNMCSGYLQAAAYQGLNGVAGRAG